MKKRLAFFLCILMLVTAVATTVMATDLNEGDDFARLTWFFNESGIQVPDDSYFMKKILEDINIELVHIAPQGTDYEERLMVLIASDEVPDIIYTYDQLTTKLLADNLIIPLEDYLNPETLPNYFRISRDAAVEIENSRMRDGHIYTIPSIRSNTLDAGPWIRTDWLEKLGLEMPTTMDELADVLVAFAEAGDINGDGTVTYATMANEFWGLASFFEAFGCTWEWYMGEDGLPEIGLLNPRIKDALAYIKNLIDSGAMNRDIVTSNYDQISEKVEAGLVGYLYGWNGNVSRKKIQEIYPDADWKPMFPAQGVYDRGYIGVKTGSTVRDTYAISTSCKDVDAVLRLFEYMCEDASDESGMVYEGGYWNYLGEPGVNWELIGGIPELGDGSSGDEAAAKKYADQNQIDRWAGWPARRFQNQYDIRWAGFDPYDVETVKYRLTIPRGADIPDDDPLKALTLTGISVDTVNIFFDDWCYVKFAEQLCYDAILGKGDIDALYEQFLANANAAGYQEVRAELAAAMAE